MQLSATGIERLALAGDVLAAAGGETVSLHDLGGSPSGEVALPWPAHELALSPSGRLLAAAPRPPRKELVLHDRATGESRRVPNTGDAWLSGFAVLEHDGAELLAVARDQRTVSLLDPGGEELARVGGGGVEFDTLVAIPPRRLASVGHATGESRDSLVVAALPGGDGAHEELDYAYRLIAGPAGQGAFVAFRDPEDAEEPDEDDVDAPEGDLHGFRGLYVRAASGELLQRIEWDGPVRRGDGILATAHTIAIAMTGAVALVPRARGGTPVTHPARTAALDPAGGRVALLGDDGVRVLDLP